MPLLGFWKKKEADERSPQESDFAELDKPPKPPEFDITGPEFPSNEEIPPLEQKPVHTDDLETLPTEAPAELPQLEQPEQQVREVVEIPKLPDFTELQLPEQPALQVEKPQPLPKQHKIRPMPESVQLQRGPLFINMDGYKQVFGSLAHAISSVRDADAKIATMASDRSKEETLYGKFQSSLDQAERKLMYIDETLFGGDQYGGE